MASSMPSEQLQLLIAGYVLGDLDPEEAMAFEQLLAENPDIMAEIRQMQKALELAYAPAEVQPPENLRLTVLLQSQPPALQATTVQQRPFPWSKTLSAAAAVLLVALGINNYRLWQSLQALRAQQQQFDPLTYSLKATNPANLATARARVVVDPNTLEANLMVDNLPPPPPGKVYVLWTVVKAGAPLTTDDKNAILTEVFQVNAQGDLTETISVPDVYRSEGLITRVAVTVEDANSPQVHAGTPVLITGS